MTSLSGEIREHRNFKKGGKTQQIHSVLFSVEVLNALCQGFLSSQQLYNKVY